MLVGNNSRMSGARLVFEPKVVDHPIKRRETWLKILLVHFWDLVKVTATMKRLYTLIVLFGLVLGGLVTGCNQENKDTGTSSTNMPPSTSTNK